MKMIKTVNQLTSISVSVLVTIGCMLSLTPSLTAQVPSTPETESDNGSLDDLSNDPNRLTIWTCLQGDKKIKVDAENYSGWQDTIEGDGWECSQPEQIPDSVSGANQFTCEPQDGTIGLLSITWLEGTGGKEQIQAWMKEIESKPGQGCQMSQVESLDPE